MSVPAESALSLKFSRSKSRESPSSSASACSLSPKTSYLSHPESLHLSVSGSSQADMQAMLDNDRNGKNKQNSENYNHKH